MPLQNADDDNSKLANLEIMHATLFYFLASYLYVAMKRNDGGDFQLLSKINMRTSRRGRRDGF
jgi:hypothetical protein